jgi:transcriptional regulator GlxA family with amidase domain
MDPLSGTFPLAADDRRRSGRAPATRALVREHGALGDRQIGRALLLMHQRPGRAWTVAGLGTEVGLSHAGFAARFEALVGLPPLDYLQRWGQGQEHRLPQPA